MEAALAPAEGAQGAEGTQEGTQDGQQQGGLDLAPLMEHMDERMEHGFNELANRFQGPEEGQQQQEADPYGLGEDGEFDLDQAAEGLYDEEGQVDPQAAQQFLGQLVDQRAGQLLEQRLGPVMQTMGELTNAHNATLLAQQYPQLQQPEVANAVSDRAMQVASHLGLDEESAVTFSNNPAILELVLMAGQGEQAARGEPVEGRQELDLESGGTAGQGQSQENIGQQIVGAGGNKSFWTGG